MSDPSCTVRGCKAEAHHEFTWTLSRDGWGEIDVHGHFCCQHFDMLFADRTPLLDLHIGGSVRA